MTKGKELANVADEESLALLRNSFPVDPGFQRQNFPRIGMYSKDVTEGKGKAMKVVTEAGMFYIERQSDDIDPETGKKKWVKEEIGTEINVIILYQRKQLRFYDGEFFTSSTVFDNDDEVVTLFKNKQIVEKGLPADLKALPQFAGKNAKGKDVSKLEDNRLLFVLWNDEVYQLNIRGGSMYAFLTFARQQSPNTVLTTIGSEYKENGGITWNQMTFKVARVINTDEVNVILDKTAEIKGNIEAEKGYFAAKNNEEGSVKVMSEAEKEFLGLAS